MNYLVKNRFLRGFFKCIDFLGYKYFQKKTNPPIQTVQKILLCNIAHLGDAVIFSSLLPFIRSFDKKIKIGVLINSASQPIFSENPHVEWIHSLDHWKLNRSSIHKTKKIVHYFFRKKKTVKSIRKVKYDVAIDFYPFFPNANLVLWKSKIPTRIGYNSGGFGFFLTKSFSWVDSNEFILSYHIKLLESVFPNYSMSIAKPSLLVKNHNSFKLQHYVMFHIGTGNPIKEWPENRWKELFRRLQSWNSPFVFTGQGKREKQLVSNVINEYKNYISLVDQLSLGGLMGLVSKAKLVVCCDSLPVHLAWAYEKPAVILQIGTKDPDLWTPPNPKATYLRPSLDKEGISVDTVLREIQEKLD